MKIKMIWLAFICFMVSCISGCTIPGSNTGNNGTDDNLDELLKDEPGATEFRVYFNYLDGSEYEVKYVQAGKRVLAPTAKVKEGFAFDGWYQDKNFVSKFDFSTNISQSIMLYAKYVEVETGNYEHILDQYVPSTVTNDLSFPKRIDEYPGVTFIWSTSDKNTISYEGVVNPGREEETVTINLEVIENGNSTHYSREVIVEPVYFKKLVPGRIQFGYYATYNFNGYTEEQLKCDVVNVSFAFVNGDFTLDLRDVTSKIGGYVKARKEGVRVVLSVQGYGDSSGNFSNAAKTPESRAKLAQSMLEAVELYNLDGIDIDWEYPGWFTNNTDKHSEAENFTLLIKEIYELFKGKDSDYLVTAALPGGAEGYKRYDLDEVCEYLDFIHLMTYDLEVSSHAYHHTALYSNLGKATGTNASVADSVQLFTLRGVPSEKLVIGIAFYGKYKTVTETNPNKVLGSINNASSFKSIPYTTIKSRYLDSVGDGVHYFWDSTCKAPYLYVEDSKMFITYDNEESIAEKCRFMRNNSLGGVMIWELGEDQVGDLMKAVNQGMKR